MTLDLNHRIFLSPEEMDRLPDPNRIREYAANQMRQLGVSFPAPPATPPPGISERSIPLMTNNELIDLYAILVSYSAYLGEQVAYAESDEKIIKQRAKAMLAFLREKAYRNGYKKDAEVNSMANTNPQVLQVAEDVLRYELCADVLKQAQKYAEEGAKLLSRSIETRKLEFQQTNRNENIGRPSFSVTRGQPTRVSPFSNRNNG